MTVNELLKWADLGESLTDLTPPKGLVAQLAIALRAERARSERLAEALRPFTSDWLYYGRSAPTFDSLQNARAALVEKREAVTVDDLLTRFEERWLLSKGGELAADADIADALECDSLTADFVADARAVANALRAERARTAQLEHGMLEAWEWLAGVHKSGGDALKRVRKAETVISTHAEWEQKHSAGASKFASEELEYESGDLHERLKAECARSERLAEALRPFADAAEKVPTWREVTSYIGEINFDSSITLQHLLAARAALAKARAK